MTKKTNENRVVYAALILVLTVLSLIVIATGIASRRNDAPKETEMETVTETDGKDVGAIITTKPKDTAPDTVKKDETTETKAPETEKPTEDEEDDEIVTAAPIVDDGKDEGCGGVMSATFATLALIALGAVCIKKRD